ncbi:MAG TPA: 3-dehydroquinate synthase [Verrucomicrobiae bacterium]|nr:3-dehydroquinate synthase [Verrucomicrobiae bacterium]
MDSFMDSIERTVRANWQHRVIFTEAVFDPANLILRDTLTAKQRSKTLVVVDQGLVNACPGAAEGISRYFAVHDPPLRLVCPPLIREGGEAAKSSWEYVTEIHRAMDHYHLDRHSYVVAVGGGALLDQVGLAAATAHRGVRHVRIPSTTLSQCDSGVGVKNGINAFGKKNFIGTFAPPFAVINDFRLLSTLPAREKRAGYAEAVKVACIRDAEFFKALECDALLLQRFDSEAMRRLIRRCAELHVDHIVGGGDPFESGSARPLDFGHWSAHKLEHLSDFRISHGLAVAIGIALDVVYSKRMGYVDIGNAERVLRLLEELGFDLFTPELLVNGPTHRLAVLAGLEEFREHLGGELTLTLLRAIGEAFEVHEINLGVLIESIHELQARRAARRLNALLAAV